MFSSLPKKKRIENREKCWRIDSISELRREEEEQEQKTRDHGSKQLFLLIVFSLSRMFEME